jgi:hypothetical protein
LALSQAVSADGPYVRELHPEVGGRDFNNIEGLAGENLGYASDGAGCDVLDSTYWPDVLGLEQFLRGHIGGSDSG